MPTGCVALPTCCVVEPTTCATTCKPTRTGGVQSLQLQDLWLVRIGCSDVDLKFLMLAVDLGPDTVLRIPDPADARAERTAQHPEAVGSLVCAAPRVAEQGPDIPVPSKPCVSLAMTFCALKDLNYTSFSGLLL